MTLESPSDDALVGASVAPDIAARVTLHRTETVEMARRRWTLSTRLDLPAGEQVAIEPGGTHLMLEELAAPLVDGSRSTSPSTSRRAGSGRHRRGHSGDT